ncbi:SWD3 [Candida theae]|uniref:SWD3 n=1 Tax=Candida theae TaxID=1198502 RepID=A0AAD5BHV4_9ASCO|nr:SWD3 [Candida theae]KAI5964454.1 SWD3 [Candida theae]
MGMALDPQLDNADSDLYVLKTTIKEPHPITSIRISPNGSLIALATRNKIKLYNLQGQFRGELLGHTKGISDIRFSPINSSVLASCSDDLTIRLWSIHNPSLSSTSQSSTKCIKIFKKHTYHITTIRFNSKGNLLISGSADETITIWDVITGKILTTLAAHSDPISSLTLTPDNSIIISASYDGLIRLFDLETYQCLKTLTTSTSHGTATSSLSTADLQNFPVANVEQSPNGKYILSTSLDGVVRLWDYMSNKVVKTFVGPGEKPVCEKYSCESRFIVIGSGGDGVGSGSGAGAGENGSNCIVSGSDLSGVLCWDIKSKDLVWQYKQDTNTSDSVDDAAENNAILTLDTFEMGKLLVTGGLNGVANVFELNANWKRK